MSNDLYREPSHSELKSICAGYLRALSFVVETEKTLPNGRIADVYATGTFGILIVECKTILKDALVKSAHEKYSRHANSVYVASSEAEVAMYLTANQIVGWALPHDAIGILSVSWERVSAARNAVWHLFEPMAATEEPLAR